MQSFLRFVFNTILFILTVYNAFAQSNSFVFHKLGIKDGLSEATVRAISEDHKGFMWFGSENGLNRYDGYNFTVYQNQKDDPYSINSNRIKYIFNDTKGNVWIGTRYGLNIFDPLKNRFFNSNTDSIVALKYLLGDIESIMEDSKGIIWVTINGVGLFRIDSFEKKPIRYQYPDPIIKNAFTVITEDATNNLWIGTEDGLLYFDTKKQTFKDCRKSFGSGYQIKGMYLYKNNILWLATTNGLRKISIATGNVKEYFHDIDNPKSISGNNISAIIPIGNHLLVGIDGNGLDEFIIEKEIFIHHTYENGSNLSSNNITGLYQDSKKTLWIGSFLNGINFSNSITNFFVSVENNPGSKTRISNGIVSSFLKDKKGNLWISTDGGGLYLKEKGSSVYERFTSDDITPIIHSNAVIKIFEDNTGTIWIATYGGGVTAYKSRTDFTIYKHIESDTNSIIWDKVKGLGEYNNEIWISTYGMGISVFNLKTQTFRHYINNSTDSNSIHTNWVYVFKKDSKNRFWLGTNEGICEYLPKTNQFKKYLFENTQKSDINFVFDILEDKEGNLWVATQGGGLILFDRNTHKHISYSTKNGLSDNLVKAMIEDNIGNIWLTNKNSITKFNIKSRIATPYAIEDGLPIKSFYPNSTFKDAQGKIYFGTNDGYLIIEPNLSNASSSFPKVILTDFRIFNLQITPNLKDTPLPISIEEAKEVTLDYNQNTLSFSFAALNFIIPKQNHYAYMLEGFDDSWTYTDNQRVAKYTNLDPGVYIFKVKASNNKNIWDDAVTTEFKITIHPPFWKTWWFNILILLSILILIYVFISIRIKSVKKRNEWLNKLVIERTKQLENTNSILTEQKTTVEIQSLQILNQQKELLDKKETLEENVKQLAASNEFQKRLISIIGHDIRGPLHQFSMLFKYMNSDSAEWAMDKMKEMSTSISLLATNLLDWATLKVDDNKLSTSHFSWKSVVDKSYKELETAYVSKNITFNISVSEVDEITGVPPIVLAAIRNILSNSIRFSPEEGIIEIRSEILNEQYTRLRITDFGQGFVVAEVNKMIQGEAFNGMKESSLTVGAGLGMAICNDMLKKTGGWIEAARIEGSGATFYIYLPYKKSNT
jgi:ligand-binding sensor domain-containing protein/signal transduction histidine kinase